MMEADSGSAVHLSRCQPLSGYYFCSPYKPTGMQYLHAIGTVKQTRCRMVSGTVSNYAFWIPKQEITKLFFRTPIHDLGSA